MNDSLVEAMNKKKKVHFHIHSWIASLYIIFSLVLIPWIVYLSVSLPSRHLSNHWDISWVGLDIGIFASLFLTGILAFIKSRWMVISSTATAIFLITDAWFDIVSERPGVELSQAILLAVIFEIPLALISLSIAIRVLNHNID